MKGGEKVKILELHQVGSTTWGRTAKGWISLYYVQLDAVTSAEGAVVKTVTASKLTVYSGAGEDYAKVATYQRNNKIIILEQASVGNTLWGRTDLGWVRMDSVQ